MAASFLNTTTDCQTAPFPFWATQATHVTETLALSSAAAYSQLMRIVRAIMLQTRLFPLLIVMALSITVSGATRVHVIALGKWTSVQWFPGGADDKPLTLKIRALVVDGRVKEFVLGAPHEVTDRLFVVRRMFRVNDSLPTIPLHVGSGSEEAGCWSTA